MRTVNKELEAKIGEYKSLVRELFENKIRCGAVISVLDGAANQPLTDAMSVYNTLTEKFLYLYDDLNVQEPVATSKDVDIVISFIKEFETKITASIMSLTTELMVLEKEDPYYDIILNLFPDDARKDIEACHADISDEDRDKVSDNKDMLETAISEAISDNADEIKNGNSDRILKDIEKKISDAKEEYDTSIKEIKAEAKTSSETLFQEYRESMAKLDEEVVTVEVKRISKPATTSSSSDWTIGEVAIAAVATVAVGYAAFKAFEYFSDSDTIVVDDYDSFFDGEDMNW